MKKSKLTSALLVLIAGIASLMSACSEEEIDLTKYKTHYAMIPDSLEILAGNNRVKVWAVISDPEVTQLKLYWNDKADSLEIPVNSTSKPDTISKIIENLPEGAYNFSVYTFDKNGVSSRKLDLSSETYGDTFIGSITNRKVNRSVIVNGESRVIWDSDIAPADIGVEIRYKNLDGEEQERWVPLGSDNGITRINEDVLDNTIQYRTILLPANGIDTLYTAYETLSLVPAVPAVLDKGKFTEKILPTDAGKSKYAKSGMDGLWDGVADNSGFWGTADLASPHWFTFDMGVTANLSRYVVQQRPGNASYNLLYNNANMKKWEIWGSNDPNEDGSWESWTKLMDCESVKPSGLPRGQLSEDDINKGLITGETFTFPKNTPPVRYIRIKVLDTWDTNQNDHCLVGEMTFYGILE